MAEHARILVVDDEPAVQQALTRALTLERYDVEQMAPFYRTPRPSRLSSPRPTRLDDPLFAVGVNQNHRPSRARLFREDRAQAGKIRPDEGGAKWIPRRPFGDPILDRGVEPL